MQTPPVEINAATELYARLTHQAALRQLSIMDLFHGASTLLSMQQRPLVAELYKVWIALNGDHELLHAVHFNYGVTLADLRDFAGAINAFRDSIRCKPDFAPPYINLGRALEDIGQTGQAIGEWMKLINSLAGVSGEAVSHKLTVMHQTARVLEGLGNDVAAEEILRQSLDIDRRQSEALQHWVSLRQRQCKWPVLQESERVKRKDMLNGISTLSLANLTDDPMFQLAKAWHYARHQIGMPKPVRAAPASLRQDLLRKDPLRLKIGYVSSDLREHAVGFAMTDVVEQHDRERFEIFAYYCGINRPDATQARTKASVDHWTEITMMTDDQAAAKIAADGIDILVDLNGYTKDARTKVFARRPAPVNVNWFGYPSTMGTPYHHYIIADDVVVPPESELYYSEKVLRLPCYQPNDRKRVVAERRPVRAEAGLPDNAFVFCSLNGMQKTTPITFDRWIAILNRVPNSVLWLLTSTTETNERLRKYAADRGVGPERIVFAEKMSNPDHLARYPLADLFLDNFPYGAHTTASDSMWMGVPILTLPGRSFASRVCASLVTAAGIGEMVCATPEQYVERAVAFGNDPSSLAPVKAKLAAGRDTCTLFDTPQLVRHLEDLYRQMWADLIRGAIPVPDLRNLDVYHEIGLGLDLENLETLGDDACAALYREKLAEWHEVYPIGPDSRLWRDGAPRVQSIGEARAVA
ncbi:MAG: glycosyl transferase [Xanthobacteraceae bacterium]|nr:glycosyl transferase [Xanthobacteraceae bacterium]